MSAHPDVVFSKRALAFARAEGLNGPVFNSHNLGGWLAWTMYPDVRVFQDSRLQAYPPEHFRAILDASRSQAGMGRARIRRRLGHSVRATAERAVRRRPLSDRSPGRPCMRTRPLRFSCGATGDTPT